jgi:hypothetical protein
MTLSSMADSGIIRQVVLHKRTKIVNILINYNYHSGDALISEVCHDREEKSPFRQGEKENL